MSRNRKLRLISKLRESQTIRGGIGRPGMSVVWMAAALIALASCRDETGVAPLPASKSAPGPRTKLATVFGSSTATYDDVGNFGQNAAWSPIIGDNGDLTGTMASPNGRVGVRWSPNDGLQELGAPPTCAASVPSDLNMSGTIVGTGVTCGPYPSQESLAFRWDKGTGFTLLARPTSPCAYRSAAAAINNNGVIAGLVVISPCVYALAAWLPDGSIVTYYSSAYAYYGVSDINEAGQITGSATLPGGNTSVAFVWTPGGAFTALPSFATDARGMVATDINENGTVVGYGYVSAGSDDTHAFRWTPNGGLQDLLPASSGFTRSGAAGVSDAEEVFGTLSNNYVPGQRGFYWTPASGMEEMGLPANATAIGVTDASSSGIATGWIRVGTADHAFRWTKDNGFEDLGTGVGFASTGYSLNDAGQVAGMVWVNTADLIRWARWGMVTNQPPSASVGGPYSGSEGASVSFDGSASTDPDSDPLTYAWDFGDGTTGSGATTTHAYADNGSYAVSLTVTDGKGGSDMKSTTATIASVSPTGTLVVPGTDVPQGTQFTVSIENATDPSPADVAAGLRYAFDCENDGTFPTPSSTASATCTIATAGAHVVAGRVIDKNGAASTYSASVMITTGACFAQPVGLVAWWTGDDSPSDAAGTSNGTLLNGTGYADGRVGRAFQLDGVDDGILIGQPPAVNVGPGAGLTLAAWIYPTGDGSSSVFGSGPVFEYANGVHFWQEPGLTGLWVNVLGTDGVQHGLNGGPVVQNAWNHIAVTFDRLTGSAVMYLNGSPVSGSGFGQFTPQTSTVLHLGMRPSGSFSLPGSFNGRLDELQIYGRALSGSEVQAIVNAGSLGVCKTPANTAPVASVGGPYTGSEGSAVSFTAAGSSDADNDALTYSWNFGDGATGSGLTPAHAYADNGTYTVSVTVSDGNGGTDTKSTTAAIANVAPTGTFTVPASANEGSAFQISITNASDASSADVAAGFTFAFDCEGDGTFTSASGTSAVSCPTTDNGSRAVSGRVIDKDGATRTYSATVSIMNVAPTWSDVLPAKAVLSGQDVAVANNITDPGAADAPWSWTVDWGTGAPSTGSLVAQGMYMSASRTYCAAGSYTVTLSATDKDGGTGTTSFAVAVSRRSVSADVAGSINLSGKNSRINVNVLSNATFDATRIDMSSATLGDGAGTEARAVSMIASDLNGDGRVDAQLVFSREDAVRNGDLTAATKQLVLRATLNDGCIQVSSTMPVKVK